jgi:hypothetical protein
LTAVRGSSRPELSVPNYSNSSFGTDQFNFDTIPLKPKQGLSGAPGWI